MSSEFVSHIQWVYTEFDSTLISIFKILTKDNTRILLDHFYISQNFTVFYIYIVEDINFVCKRYWSLPKSSWQSHRGQAHFDINFNVLVGLTITKHCQNVFGPVGRAYVWTSLKINVNFLYEIKSRTTLNVFLWCKLPIGFYNIEFN